MASRGSPAPAAYGLTAAVLLLPAVAAGQIAYHHHPGHGTVAAHQGGVLLSATGEGSATGVSEGTARVDDPVRVVHFTGWLGAHRVIDRTGPPQLFGVRVEALTPDAAVVVFAASKEVTGTVDYGRSTRRDRSAQSEHAANRLRIVGLTPGALYHYRLTLRDLAGREVSSRDLTFCTPGDDELVPRRLAASYYRGQAFDALHVSRWEDGIDQPATSGDASTGDFLSGAGPDDFSARWTGLLRITRGANYRLHGTANDGQRLIVDAERVLDDWVERDEAVTASTQVELDRSWHAISYEMFEATGAARATLELEGAGIARGPLNPASLASIREAFYQPTIEPRELPVVLECESPQGTAAELEPLAVFDCVDPSPSLSSDAPQRFPPGETRVVWTARNRTGHRARLAEFVQVEDTQPPRLVAPEPLVLEATSPAGTPVAPAAPALEDACDPEPAVTWHVCLRDDAPCQACFTEEDEADDPAQEAGVRDPSCVCDPAPERFGLGSTVLTAIARDRSDNCGDTPLAVTIVDTTPPEVDAGDVEVVCLTAPIPHVTVRDNSTAEIDIGLVCSVDGEDPAASCDRVLDYERGPHFVDVTAVDGEQNTTTVRVEFVVDDQDPAPPLLEVVARPEGFSNGPVALTVRVADNCDPEPEVAFNPSEGDLAVEGSRYTAFYGSEAIHSVDVAATDDAGNPATLSDIVFGIDLTDPTASFSGLDAPADPADALTYPVLFSGDVVPFSAGARDSAGPANSGLSRLEVVLEDLAAAAGEPRVLHASTYEADGDEPQTGPSRLKNKACAEQVVAGEPAWCDGDGDLLVPPDIGGDWRLAVTSVDVAGNAGELERFFTVMSWRTALERAREMADRILAGEREDVTALFLQQIPDNLADAVVAVDDERLLGNALLYSYTFVDALEYASGRGHDIGGTSGWLSRAAYQRMAARYVEVEDAVGGDEPDVQQGSDRMDTARDHLQSDPPAHGASVLALLNAHFYLEHALDPFLIEDDVGAQMASVRLKEALDAYLALEAANGQDVVTLVAEQQNAIRVGLLFERVVARDVGNVGATNLAFRDLLERLAVISELLADAQDAWVWTRNWQWPVSLQVRILAGIGLEMAALQLGQDPEALTDPLLIHAWSVYDRGVEFIDDRLVDEALDVYVDGRCLIHEVYNHALFEPQAVPPDDWNCDECVLTGDCVH